MKKILQKFVEPRIMALLVFGVLMTLPAFALDFAYTYEGQTLTYTVLDANAKTVGTKAGRSSYAGNKVSGDLVIPQTVVYKDEEYSVTSIGGCAFNECSGLTSVVIPNSVTSIGEYAFYECDGLTSVVIGNSVTSIGVCAFDKCSGLTSVVIGNSVTSIGSYAFDNCSGLTSVVIPNSVTSIGEYAFYECSGLTSVVIGNSVTSIGIAAFKGCSGLTSVVIPNSVTSIGVSAFHGCSGLTSVVIGNSVTSIGNYAFYGCSGLTSVVIPNSVTSIGDYAFYDCSGLTSVVIPNSVTSIGFYAFNGCYKLKKSAYPNSISKPFFSGVAIAYDPEGAIIEDGWVYGPNKTSIMFAPYTLSGDFVIPEGVTEIGDYAFYGCSGLTSVGIPGSVTSIGNYAFSNCNSITIIKNLATEVPSIDQSTFDQDQYVNIEVVVPDEALINYIDSPNWNRFFKLRTNTINSETFANGGLNYRIIGDNELILISGDYSSLTSANLSKRIAYDNKFFYVTAIGNGAFALCSKLKEVTLYNKLRYIGPSAFYACHGLTSVEIPNSVTSIGNSAFQDCSGLTSVVIPNSVTSIGNSAFQDCNGLTSVLIGNSVTSIGDYVFKGCSGLTSVEIPNSVTSIGNSAFQDCNGLTSVLIGYSVTSIGNSAFQDCDGLIFVGIPNSVTSIGNSAFQDCDDLNLVIIPNSVTSIGDRAYSFCSNLGDFTVESGDATIFFGTEVFYQSLLKSLSLGRNWTYTEKGSISTSLYSVTIGDKVTCLPDYAFSGCTFLTSIEIPNGVTSIGEYAFKSTKISSITLPGSLETINLNAFNNCSQLTELSFEHGRHPINIIGKLNSLNISTLMLDRDILEGTSFTLPNLLSLTIGNSVNAINANQFKGCSKLNTLHLGASLQSIGESAFQNCALTEIVLSPDVTTVGANAFNGNPLTTITIGSKIAEIGDNAFGKKGVNISDIYITATTIPDATDNSFSDNNGQLWVMPGMVDEYYSSIPCFYAFEDGKELIPATNITIANSIDWSEVNIGDEVTLQASVSPQDATLTQLFYRSTNPEIATIDENGRVKILSDTHGEECNFIVESLYPGISTTVKLSNEGIALDKKSLSLIVGEEETLTVSLRADTEQSGETFDYKWATSNADVAKVNEDGVVTAILPGEATITVTATGSQGSVYTAECAVTVNAHFTLNTSTVRIEPDESYQLGAISDNEDLQITWSSSDASIAYVNNYGLVTSMGIDGECDITARNMGVEVICHVVVSSAEYPLMPEYLNYSKGAGNTITITESSNATGDIVIPEKVTIDGQVYTVTAIGERAFADAYQKITSIYVPNSVTTIAKHAFIHCENLTYLHLGSGLKSIGEGALGFAKIDVMECEAVTPPTLDTDCMWSFSANTIRVPMESVDIYKNTSYSGAYGWSNMKSYIVGYDFDNSPARARAAAEVSPIAPTAIVYESVTKDPYMLNVRLEPVGASTTIDWQSSNPDAATIDHGIITFLSNAPTVFTATTANGLSAESPEVKQDDAAIDLIFNDNDSPVEYYNLNGIRINGDSLAPGLYIRRQGNKVEKILVK